MLTRPRANARNRRKGDPSKPQHGSVPTAVVALAGTDITITSNQVLSVSGLPAIGATGGAHVGTETPASVTVNSPTQLTVTFPNDCAIGDAITIPSFMEGIRTSSGGYLPPSATALV